MSNGLNRVILLGYIGAPPELRYTNGGAPVLSFRLATSESYVDKNRETQERTDWHSVVVWGARAEALEKTLAKGACVLVEGSLRTSSYEKEGMKQYRTEIIADDVFLAGGKTASSSRDLAPEHVNGTPARQAAAEQIPF